MILVHRARSRTRKREQPREIVEVRVHTTSAADIGSRWLLTGASIFLIAAYFLFAYAYGSHKQATGDPAAARSALGAGNIALVFNQPVSGKVDIVLDDSTRRTMTQMSQIGEPDGSGVTCIKYCAQITITAHIQRKQHASPLQWAVLSSGPLKLLPFITAMSGTEAQGQETSGGMVLASNIDRNSCVPKNFKHSLIRSEEEKKLADIVVCSAKLASNPNPDAITANVAIHTGSVNDTTANDLQLQLTGAVARVSEFAQAGRIQGRAGMIGGRDALSLMTAALMADADADADAKNGTHQPESNFTVAASSLNVQETVINDWTDSQGVLIPEASVMHSDPALPDSRKLSWNWSGLSKQTEMSWEIENQIEREKYQSQDFLSGIWLATAAAMAISGLTVAGKVIGPWLTRAKKS
ncbi:hypothetical protein [Streptomyces sp. NBC_00986]|uniref:hypothetical protein n=1 Tax=Streptomyces sp. NBC_00986 TaxID=2903702 RepID=UPI0038642D5B|nr:hypothetical protein OG504_33105 [Streptomyces sp. NBC_00986]